MAIIIKEATSAHELQDVLSVRYQSILQTGRGADTLFSITKKISDHYDAFPTTTNVVGYQDGMPVAGIRAYEYHEQDDYANCLYDFREAVAKLEGSIFNIDMLCLMKEISWMEHFAQTLLKTVVGLLARQKGQHALFLCTKDRVESMEDLGFEQIAEGYHSKKLALDVVPMIANIPELYDRFILAIKDREILRFQETFYRIMYRAGEIMMVEGERGSNAIIVESGKIAVVSRVDDTVSRLVSLGPGALVGEMGLITNEPRSVSIIAETNCTCLAFDRESFLDVLYKNPSRMLDLFQIPAKRLKDLSKELMKARSA